MRAHELTVGRTFGVTFDHGEDFFEALSTFCRDNGVRQGYIPSFNRGPRGGRDRGLLREARGPGRTGLGEDVRHQRRGVRRRHPRHAPATGEILPHIHVSAGLKAQSADGRTSHLLSAEVQFLSELLIVEVTSPTMTRPRNPDLYDVPLLTFG
ncbi:DUF296 domain-containing protein [Streptomyces sp. NPDC014864]|uniref:DUF296 domain-containing protein n=1 Tax=Streptomyces sp. NPDC014864 TaxID=3364924 RepID=UPI00370048A2